MPYVRVYDGEKGVREILLEKAETVIGCETGVDICLHDSTIAGRHAVIKPYEKGHLIEDLGSGSGILVNGHQMPRCQLAHEVTIHVGPCVMEYRTDDAERVADHKSDSPITQKLRDSFSVLPHEVKMRYRLIKGTPDKLFKTGDTLNFGDGGVLLPAAEGMDAAQCMEVEITPQDGTSRAFLGEVVAVLEDHATPQMCIKLHFLGKAKHEQLTQGAGEWCEVISPA